MENALYSDQIQERISQLLSGKTVFITGATGLIGCALIKRLVTCGERMEDSPRVIALVRNLERAKYLFDYPGAENIQFVVGDVSDSIEIGDKVDYIIHAASQTASKAFVELPVETIRTALNGTHNMLELAREKKVNGFVYLSSMEVYGSPASDEKIREDHGTNLNTMSVRSSYPEGKRICENLCTAYWSEYGVPAKVIRLTQTFGPGVRYHDSRVFAEFARCAIEKRDIVLHTKGETKRSYLYTEDAVDAILTVLLQGEPGEAYNAANEETYCSIYEMAHLVTNKCAEGQIAVRIQLDNAERGYAPELKMNLDTGKLRSLGWRPTKDLCNMFEKLISSMQTELGNE